MKKQKTILVYKLIIILIFIISCSRVKNNPISERDNNDSILSLALKKNPYIKIDSAKRFQKNKGNYDDGRGEFEYYSYYGKLSDTIIGLSFQLYLTDSLILINDYIKTYSDSIYMYCLALNEDTLYHYRYSEGNKKNKIFLQGKYYYLFKSGNLNPKQSKYFLTYKDSLIKIKGDNLPKLSEID